MEDQEDKKDLITQKDGLEELTGHDVPAEGIPLQSKLDKNAHAAQDQLYYRIIAGEMSDKNLITVSTDLYDRSFEGNKMRAAHTTHESKKIAEALIAGLGPIAQMSGVPEVEIRKILPHGKEEEQKQKQEA